MLLLMSFKSAWDEVGRTIASAGLLDAFASGEIATRIRRARLSSLFRETLEHIDRENWRGARLKLEAFRRQNLGGVVVLGREYHLRLFLVHATDLDSWLRSRTGAEAQEVVHTAHGKREVPQMGSQHSCCIGSRFRGGHDAGRYTSTTIRSRTLWQKWLEEQMRASPTQPRSKATMRKEGGSAGLPEVSDRGISAVAWGAAAIAAEAPRWQGRQGAGHHPRAVQPLAKGCGDFRKCVVLALDLIAAPEIAAAI